MTTKAIETRYKGYRFRSRLEARWAVFFDALRVPYEYERQGFDLGEAGPYLPDFWLPTWRRWVEVKPAEPERGYLVKPTAFSWGHGNDLLLILGPPWPGEHLVEAFSPPDQVYQYGEFADCRRCDGVCLLMPEELVGAQVAGFPVECSCWGNVGPHTCDDHDKWPISMLGQLTTLRRCAKAYEAARSARFEYGETPRA